MRVLIVWMLCCTVVVAAGTASLPQVPAQQVVARVNGVELRGATLNDYVEAVLPDFSFHGKVQPAKLNEYRRAALDRMVLHELIYQEGVRRRVAIPPARVDSEVALMRGRFRSPEAFQHALSEHGLTLDQLRAHIQRSLVIAAVVRRDITSRAVVTNQEVLAYYRKNLPRFHEPEVVHLREISIPPGPLGAKQAGDVRAQAAAKNTSDQFDLLASRYSKDDYRVMGGDLGWIHRGGMDPDLEKTAFALHPGQLSPVIQTKTGFYLLRLEAKRPARLVPFSEMKDKIRAQLLAEKRKQLSDALRARVSKNSKIELLAKF